MLAAGKDGGDVAERLVGDAAILLRQELHGEMDAIELAAFDRQIARLFGAAGEHHGIVFLPQLFDRHLDTDLHVVMEGNALGFHLGDAAVDVVLFHLEVRDAVTEQAAGLTVLLIEVDVMPGSGELLGAGHARGTRTDDGHGLAGLLRIDLRPDPAVFPTLVDDGAFDGLDGDRGIRNVERASRLARGRADAAGKFREIIG